MNCTDFFIRLFQHTCVGAALVVLLGGCGQRSEPTAGVLPTEFISSDIVINGTSFPTKELTGLKAGTNFKASSDDIALIHILTQDNGVIELSYANGDIIRVSSDGSFITIPTTPISQSH